MSNEAPTQSKTRTVSARFPLSVAQALEGYVRRHGGTQTDLIVAGTVAEIERRKRAAEAKNAQAVMDS